MSARPVHTGLWTLFRRSFAELKKNDPLRLAGATSFFATFAIPPILIILFQLFTIFLSRRLVGPEMSAILSDTLGPDTARQIRITTRGFRTIAQSWYTAAAGFVFLVFVATTLFVVIKNSLNVIWKVRVREKPGFLFYLRLRGRSFLVILAAGILFLAGLLLDGFKVLAGKYVDRVIPGGGSFLSGALNEVTGALIMTIWFFVIFRFLADARPPRKVAIYGGILTGILFSVGKALLAILLIRSNIGSIYGASGSLVLLLLFVFYASFILYFGAAFVKVYAEASQQPLRAHSDAYHYQVLEVGLNEAGKA